MKERGLPQEGLKLIACVTMLIDHIGAALTGAVWMRVVGRLAFPIYCFLLAEGVAHTRNPKRYGLRLLIGALLAEIPFDLLFYGQLTWDHQSVMVTLLLGFLYAMAARQAKGLGVKLILSIPFIWAAEFLRTDYGGDGVAMIALFLLSQEVPHKRLVQAVGLTVICFHLGGASVQMAALAALVPIFCYSGRKATANIWVQRGFYLFYPIHLLALYLIRRL